MFLFHIALALGLIALSAGTALFIWPGSGFAKVIGFLIMIVSIISTACTIYCGVTYGREGYVPCHMKMKNAMPGQDASTMKKPEM